jgi:hypothetical protein
MGTREEKEQLKQWWQQQRREAWKQFLAKMDLRLKTILSTEENSEERNDVYLYRTLRYPPRSTPPAAE